MKNIKKLFITVFSILLVTGCGTDIKLKDGQEVIGWIDGYEITAEDLFEKLKEEDGSSSLINMIDEWICDQEIDDLDSIKKTAKSTLEQYRLQYETYGYDFDDVLTSSGFEDEDDFLEYLIKQTKKEKVAEKFISDNLTDDEINTYYEENIFGTITARHILIIPDTNDDMTDEETAAAKTEAYNKAMEVIDRLNNGENFEDLVALYSEDTGSVSDGGLISDFTKDSVDAGFWSGAYALQDGEYTTEPVESSYGYHIILRVSSTEKPSLEDSLDEIKEDLTNDKLEETDVYTKTWIAIRKKYNLGISDSTIEKDYNKSISDYE
jgi:foldase protein PrsA